jgi:nitroreductase
MLEVLRLVQERQSVRALFDSGRPVSNKDLMQILEAGRWAPTPHNMQNFEIIVVDDKKLLESLGNIKYPISNSFIEENCQNLSFSEEELLRKKVGLLGTFFPPALRTPGVKLDEATYEEVRSWWGRTIQTGPILGVVAYDPKKRAPDSEGDFLGIIGLGCVLENMWLTAHSLGISFQVMSILNRNLAEEEVKRILNIPKYLKIAFGFRLGYALLTPTKYLRVRREVEDFTHHNQFGNKSFD